MFNSCRILDILNSCMVTILISDGSLTPVEINIPASKRFAGNWEDGLRN